MQLIILKGAILHIVVLLVLKVQPWSPKHQDDVLNVNKKWNAMMCNSFSTDIQVNALHSQDIQCSNC